MNLIFHKKKHATYTVITKQLLSSQRIMSNMNKQNMQVDRHFIKKKLERKTINLCYVESKDQPDDILQKLLHLKHLKNLYAC